VLTAMRAGVRVVALVEAAKGGIVLLAGLGLLTLVHRDVQAIAERAVRFSHLNPASRYPRIFLDAATNMTDARLWFLAAAAAMYAVVRGVEAYGLWRERRWAEWFAMASGALYLPVEIYELLFRFSMVKVVILTTNVVVVACMAYALLQRRSARQAALDDGL
jgi:uncharacterized membrane protein (DUF2068 family)